MKVKNAQAPHKINQKKYIYFLCLKFFKIYNLFFDIFQIYMKDPESAEYKEKPNFRFLFFEL